MCCRFTPCEQWKQQRRGYVPMDIYNAQNRNECCGFDCNCDCNCNRDCNGCYETDTENASDTDCY